MTTTIGITTKYLQAATAEKPRGRTLQWVDGSGVTYALWGWVTEIECIKGCIPDYLPAEGMSCFSVQISM